MSTPPESNTSRLRSSLRPFYDCRSRRPAAVSTLHCISVRACVIPFCVSCNSAFTCPLLPVTCHRQPPTAPAATRPPTASASRCASAMYITPDLFGGTSSHIRGDAANSNHWTAMADSAHAAGLGKRKRHETEEGPNAYGNCPNRPRSTDADSVYSSCTHHQRASPANRTSSRSHAQNLPPFEPPRGLPYALYTPTDRRPQKQMKRISPKVALIKSTSHLMDFETDPGLAKAVSHAHSPVDLRSCHACNSAPKRRKDLENYLDCRRCVGRTCYICARQCFGGCGKAVCKKCIVEVGEEGDPWCLDCYARDINS
jgi:hypothetical protein